MSIFQFKLVCDSNGDHNLQNEYYIMFNKTWNKEPKTH